MGFDSVFCPKCGGGPNIDEKPTVLYPRSRYGEVRYRYPCSGRPTCLEVIDATVADLRSLYKQIKVSEIGVHLKNLALITRKLAEDADKAPEAKDRIAAHGNGGERKNTPFRPIGNASALFSASVGASADSPAPCRITDGSAAGPPISQISLPVAAS